MSRVHSPRFWRAAYRQLDNPTVIGLASGLCRVSAWITGARPEHFASRAELAMRGWPHHLGSQWVNFNVLRFRWSVVQQLRNGDAPVVPKLPARPRTPLRVGVLATFSSTLQFVPSFFAGAPEAVELFAFDLLDRNTASFLSRWSTYREFAAEDSAGVAAAIEDADLDLLLFDVYRGDVYSILDRVRTPCVVDLGATNNPCFHPNVSFAIYCLQQADYVIRSNRMLCGTSRALLDDRVVLPGTKLFDVRGLSAGADVPWSERSPRLVFHGRLFKLSGEYLETVLQLLKEDDELEFVVVGREAEDSLRRILTAAARRGVAERVHYEGEFLIDRDASGAIDHPVRTKLASVLASARLAPDPWPFAGGTSRVEAYAAGLPVVHMGVRVAPRSWGRPQHALINDHPGLEVPRATAHTVDRYLELCRKVLRDGEFADAIAAEQREIASRVTDPANFWGQILGAYESWLASAGAPR